MTLGSPVQCLASAVHRARNDPGYVTVLSGAHNHSTYVMCTILTPTPACTGNDPGFLCVLSHCSTGIRPPSGQNLSAQLPDDPQGLPHSTCCMWKSTGGNTQSTCSLSLGTSKARIQI